MTRFTLITATVIWGAAITAFAPQVSAMEDKLMQTPTSPEVMAKVKGLYDGKIRQMVHHYW